MTDDGLISMIGRKAYERLVEPIRDYQYRYDIKFSQWNPTIVGNMKLPLGFSLSPQAGVVTISRRVAPDWRVEESWTLGMLMGQLSVSAALGVQVGADNDGVAYSDLVYSKEDFEGPIWIASLAAHGGYGEGRTGGPGVMWIEGAGFKPVLAFDLSSWVNRSAERGLGVDLSGAWGYMRLSPWQSDETKKKKPLDVPEPSVRSNDVGATSVHSTEVHFRFGHAQLTGDARQLIRVACARYRAALTTPSTHLWSIGYADRPDSPDRNRTLSVARAKNAVQAMRDALDDAFALPDDNVVACGFGETAAEASGDRPRQRNRNWRKVEVILDTQLILTLRGR